MAKWKLKSNVRLVGCQPQILFVIPLAAEIWQDAGAELVVTSANDSAHSVTSLHYAGCAIDLRTKNVGFPRVLVEELALRLGRDFDVLLEDEGGENEHVHVEWQPRSPI